MSLKHKKQSAKADGGDSSMVLPSDWNDDHIIDKGGALFDAPDINAEVEPVAPAVDKLLLFARELANKVLCVFKEAKGESTWLQAALHGKSIFFMSIASGTTAPTAFGGTLTTAATMSLAQTIASANKWLATAKKRYTSSATAGTTTGVRTAYGQWFIGNAAGFGGFFFRGKVGANTNLAGGQKFFGLCASTAALGGEPSALVNCLGMGWDAADANTGNWFFIRNDGTGTATKVDLGTNAARSNTTHGYELIMFCAPNSQEVFVRIVNIHTGVVVLNTSYTTDIPAVNTALAFKCEARNGAVAAADSIEHSQVYIESDF